VIAILCDAGTEAIGKALAHAIQTRYTPAVAPALCLAATGWTRGSEWDDLLLVVYRSAALDAPARELIAAYREAHALSAPATGERKPGGFLIPVATDPAWVKPPDPISGIKAALYDGSPASEELVLRAVGTLLGMAVRPGEHHIFLSYRSSDGMEIATDSRISPLAG
jgi:hypothetical protein